MKTKTLFTTLIAMIISTNFLIGQERTDYSTIWLENLNDSWSVSSTYWMGHTYAFFNEGGEENGMLGVTWYYISESGTVHVSDEEFLNYELSYSFQVTSCVYKKDLYGFLWHEYNKGYEILYYVKKHGHDFEEHSIHINEKVAQQMAAVSFNDTIYMFFVDDADKLIKYYEIVYSDTHSKLVLVNDTPTTLNNDYTSVGNVAAITYVNDSLKEEIMVAFPGSIEGKSNNKINLFTGKPGQFELIAQKPSVHNYHIFELSMIQGSVKGGSTGSYNIQFGYNIVNDAHKGPAQCEYSLKTNEFSDWELLDFPGHDLFYHYTWFMEFYTKTSHERKKYIVHGYNYGSGNKGILWESDLLQYEDQRDAIPPIGFASKFFDLILVVEGAPPYTTNGYKLSDSEFDFNQLSEFEYVSGTQNSISTSTTYSLGIEANMGVGPVTAGFKASFMESHGTSNTESNYITQKLIAPKIDSDSAGLMWYYYVAPTVVRSRWQMKDYDGNSIVPNRNLFFFQLNSPQMLNIKRKLNEFGENSPRAYDLTTYQGRGVPNMQGVDELVHKETVVDFAGSAASIDVDFQETHTETHGSTYEVSLGIDAEYGIFSASASVSASVEYNRERTATYENGFHIEWFLFTAKYPDNTNNIIRFTPISYIMKTTDSSAYFLTEEFKRFKPYFITYEVDSITHGNFTDPPFYIGENPDIISKYNFSNFPNPCKTNTKFVYQLPDRSHVNLTIYNTYGQTVNVPINVVQSPGQYEYEVFTLNLPAGIYYYQMLIDEDLIMGKVIKN